ncbi:hypothetical protein C8Q79DRAFT_1001441 [Trametes meyenii]|nr:hypothetical protein C8Q79DRAFT_1001441 [Trametes meyenii]
MSLPLVTLVLLAAPVFAAPQPRDECRDGLDKLNNQSGQSPCAVRSQLQQACKADPSNTDQCRCNTVVYNVGAACAACSGDNMPTWADWADENSCASNPDPFPSNVDIDSNTIPPWAHLPLSTNNDFNVSAAILDAGGSSSNPSPSRKSVATQIAVPIAAGVGVAIIAVLGFWLYRRRHHQQVRRNPRMKTLPSLPGTKNTFWQPQHWFYTVWPLARSRRLRPSKKDSDWAIDVDVDDEDTKWLGHSRGPSAASFHDAYPLVQSPLHAEPEHEPDLPHTSAHIPETSSSSLLPHLDFPDVRVPTFMERFIRFKDGLRKSSGYQAKYVSPVSPDAQFRIDGSAGPTPTARAFSIAKPPSNSKPKPKLNPSPVDTGAGRSAGSAASGAVAQPAVAERSDFEPQSEGVASSVLIISRDGEDFTIDDTATTAPSGSPRTMSMSRQTTTGSQVLSAYSGSPRTGTGTGSWLPSPARANTSSTVSGAYPFELRRDPDLASPRTWAARFPAPPQAFSQSSQAFRSFAEPTSSLGVPPRSGS